MNENSKALHEDLTERSVVCTKEHPWHKCPETAGWRVQHPDAISDGECSESCCDYWKCPNCGHRFKTEVPQ